MTSTLNSSRWRAGLVRLAPPALLVAVFYPGLWTWFHTDDFSLLWMARLPAHEFWGQLFEPRAQGTYRWLSERLFFYGFYQAFGWDAFPYRLMAFGTQIINLWLLAGLVRRLGGSAAAAGGAAALWAIHHGLAVSMSWTSAYNQVLCAFFLLAALHAFIRFAESGRFGWYLLQWGLFLVGFGALETIAVYPALALAYCLLFRRERWAWAAPMFLGSAAMAYFQLHVAGGRAEGLYQVSLAPLDLVDSLLYFVRNALAGHLPNVVGWSLAAAAAAVAVREARYGRLLAAFGWCWFGLTLAPYLPLASHRADYYLAIPAAGLAVAVAAAAEAAWKARWEFRLLAVGALGVYLFGTLSYGPPLVEMNWRRSLRCRNLLTGVAHVRAQHRDKTIVLTGVNSDFFYGSFYQDALPLAQLYDVYLAPDANSVRQWPGYRPIGRYFLTDEEALLGIERDSIVVYDASGFRLREITETYKRYAPLRLADR